MKFPPAPHGWSISPGEAVQIQKKLAAQVRPVPSPGPFRFLAGVDMSISRDGSYGIAGAVVWDCRKRIVVERKSARWKLTLPYIPGLLSFREAPPVLAALRKLEQIPDALLCDGHGLAHPRRLGMACHIGLITGIPTLGCAKSLFVGDYREPGRKRGCRTALKHRGERVGTVLRTRDGVKPVFISIGHLLDLPAAEKLAMASGKGYRLPEPTRLADQWVAVLKREAGSLEVIPQARGFTNQPGPL
jgi:deoxyribonuclease V